MTESVPFTEARQHEELDVLNGILTALRDLDEESRGRVLKTAATYYRVNLPDQTQGRGITSEPAMIGQLSEDRSMSPKAFMLQKQPMTDVEKVACLAYYLTHYRDTPHFKTLDISKLNTEGAQLKFSNAAVAMDNATKAGYLVPSTKGNKQLSAPGEIFVQKLPDREGAKAAMASFRPRRRTRKNGQSADQETAETPTGDES